MKETLVLIGVSPGIGSSKQQSNPRHFSGRVQMRLLGRCGSLTSLGQTAEKHEEHVMIEKCLHIYINNHIR